MNSVRRQTDGLNLHGRLSAFPISRMHTSSSTDNKRRQFWHKSRPQILPRLRQLGEPVAPFSIYSRLVRARSSPPSLLSPLLSPFYHFFVRSFLPCSSSTDGLIQHGELNKQKVRLPAVVPAGERKYL